MNISNSRAATPSAQARTFQAEWGMKQVGVQRGVEAEQRRERRVRGQRLRQPRVVVQAQVLLEPHLRARATKGQQVQSTCSHSLATTVVFFKGRQRPL